MIAKRITLLAVTSSLMACSQESAAENELSALPEIASLRPVIACIGERVRNSDESEVWSGGAPKGPAQKRETLEACAPGIDFVSKQPDDHLNPATYQKSVLFWSLMMFGGRRDHLTVEDFDYAIGRARCAERHALANGSFASPNPSERRPAEERALIACIPAMADIAAKTASVPSRREALAVSITNLNLNYIRSRKGLSSKADGND